MAPGGDLSADFLMYSYKVPGPADRAQHAAATLAATLPWGVCVDVDPPSSVICRA
jgi:hypothetical protein